MTVIGSVGEGAIGLLDLRADPDLLQQAPQAASSRGHHGRGGAARAARRELAIGRGRAVLAGERVRVRGRQVLVLDGRCQRRGVPLHTLDGGPEADRSRAARREVIVRGRAADPVFQYPAGSCHAVVAGSWPCRVWS
jgi:hypothetical protein